MRYRIMNRFTALLALLLTHIAASDAIAAGISAFEQLWKSKGPHTVLAPAKEKLGMNDQEMSAFVYSHYQWLSLNKSRFWVIASADTGNAGYERLNRLLDSQNAALSELVGRFDAGRKTNSSEYQRVLSNWNAATTAAATPPPTNPPCHNPGFENPANGHFDGWEGWQGVACFYKPDLSCNSFITPLSPGGFSSNLTMITAGFDPIVGGSSLPMVAPGGTHSLRLENTVNGGDAAMLKYTLTPDPSNPIYELKYALVLEDPGGGHSEQERPYFMVKAFDKTTNTEIKCGAYRVVAFAEDPEFGDMYFTPISAGSLTRFKPWTSHLIDLSGYMGHEIEITIVVSDCALGGHLGYAYIDGNCVTDNITVGPCQTNGYRSIVIDGKFESYNWRSNNNGIISSNIGNSILVSKQGKYSVFYGTANPVCYYSRSIYVDSCPKPQPNPCILSINQLSSGTCQGQDGTFEISCSLNISNYTGPGYLKFQYGSVEKFLSLPQSNPVQITLPGLRADGLKHAFRVWLFADRYVSEAIALCSLMDSLQAPEPCGNVDTPSFCENCIGSFRPQPGETYVLSAWVKEAGAPADAIAYTNAQVQLQYSGASAPSPFLASGRIIEGWQRIHQEFTIPAGATEIFVQLKTNSGTAYFDDIRIYPLKGSMKSYVYDPVSLKLVAVLDENNYATLYEYDQEGSLVRTKKETERGVVTISENRQSNPKKP